MPLDNFPITNFSRPLQQMYEAIITDEKVNVHLRAVKDYHMESYDHLVRVGKLSMYLGMKNHLVDEQLRLLGMSGALHDVGKQGISHCVLCKPGPLEPTEREEMKNHVRLGFMILEDIGEEVRRIIVCHHEFQGEAYPRNGEERRRDDRRERYIVVPKEARGVSRRGSIERRQTDAMILNLGQMVAAADVYDALSSKRGYKEPLTLEVVRDIMNKDYLGSKRYVQQLFE